MARPLTGTTAAHAGVLLALLGHERTFELFRALQDNRVRFGPGNAQVMRLVREGELDFGWTDTDDCQAAIDEGYPVAMVIPDQQADGFGLVVIPNTVSLVAGAPHPEAARRLIDWLLGPQVEERLAHGESAQGEVFAHPSATLSMQIGGAGTLIAVSLCNIHGLWESSKAVGVS